MNVKDIFALRKQGKIEEAYEAIRPIYREHKGRFTTLCMFWVASDVFKLRLEQKRVEEAEKIYEAMKRMLPHVQKIEEEDSKAASKREESPAKEQAHHKGQARGFMKFAEGRLIKESEKFRKRYFAIRDRKKRTQTVENEEIDVIPTVHPVIPTVVEYSALPLATEGTQESEEISPCASLSRDDKESDSRDDSTLNRGQQAVLNCIKANPGYRVPKIEEETNIPSKSIERHIKVLIERRLIEHRGSKKTGGYHALK